MSRVGSATFCNMSVISWWRKLEYPGKTTDLSQVTDTLNVYREQLAMSGIQTHISSSVWL